MRRRWLRIGVAIGYVLGTKAGRERYEDLRRAWFKVRTSAPARELETAIRTRLRRSGAIGGSDGRVSYAPERFAETQLS